MCIASDVASGVRSFLQMDWHTKYAWGTYTFDERILPQAQQTMAELHHHGIAVGANVHEYVEFLI